MFTIGQSGDGVTFVVFVDGEATPARQGETIAALLLRVPPHMTRRTAHSGEARAPYCMMGVCFDCSVAVDGAARVRACMTAVEPGMRIVRPAGNRSVA